MRVQHQKDIKLNNDNVLIGDITFYNVSSITIEMIDDVLSSVNVVTKNTINYINCPCAFDIETSSFLIDDKKYSVMYIWSLNINGLNIYGRTWDEFFNLLHYIHEEYALDSKYRLVIYVHNLGYEFQFMRKYFNWITLFARKTRRPIYCVSDIGIEFRCSYFLSGYALSEVAKNLTTHKIEKLDGDLDYKKIRHTKTPVNNTELRYCLNDVVILQYYISEEIERNGDISKIPLTQTGYVRRLVKENCYDKKDRKKYQNFHNVMKELTILPDEYKQLKRAFGGGYVHANAHYVNKLIKDVKSIDFSSSYPYVMISELFPMSKAHFISEPNSNEIDYYLDTHCCIFDVIFENIESNTFIDHPISVSKCFYQRNVLEDNGRLVSADKIMITITEIDLSYIKEFYEWSSIQIINLRAYKKAYLPTDFILTILDLYEKKTVLKGLENYELEYLHSKQLINSCFGMTVTDIVSDIIEYDNDIKEWKDRMNGDLEKSIDEYNRKKQRFLFYPWGIYITSYARRNLFTGIKEFAGDYIYSDTDSIKCINYDTHTEYIKNYNKQCINKLTDAFKHHNIPLNRMNPLDIKGNKHYLGVWDNDDFYYEFKTLGAKRYMYLHDENNSKKYSFTVAGCNKKNAIPYMMNISKRQKKSPIDIFDNELEIPKGHTGKSTLTYIDDEQHGLVTDYLGNTSEFHELSCIHMDDASYEFSMSGKFIDYLMGINENEYMIDEIIS